jgi:hypothetical protein
MEHEQLRKDLEQLYHDLLHVEEPADAESADTLTRLRTEIKSLLDREESTGPQFQSLGEQLKKGVYRFEASYPKLSKTMAEVIDSLALLNL